MNSRIGQFCRIAMKQMRAKELWTRHWSPLNKRSRKYFTRLNSVNKRSDKVCSKLTPDDWQTIRNAFVKHSGLRNTVRAGSTTIKKLAHLLLYNN